MIRRILKLLGFDVHVWQYSCMYNRRKCVHCGLRQDLYETVGNDKWCDMCTKFTTKPKCKF